jgi:UDP:flavonoid glycosyltransferase YjiC (YdhE family)
LTVQSKVITFSTIGSWGDLFPLIPIAKNLVGRGYLIRFAVPSAQREVVESEGFEFRAVGDGLAIDDHWSHPEIVDRRLHGLAGFRTVLRDFILPRLGEMLEGLKSACADSDALVAHPGQLAAPLVAEATGIPWITVSMFPGLIPSAETVPQGSLQPALGGPFGRLVNRASWALTRGVLSALIDRELNVARRSLGFSPVRRVFLQGSRSRLLTLVLSSEMYTPRPSDWPTEVKVTGFSHFDRPAAWQHDGSVDAFVDAGDAPVVMTLGFTGVIDPGDAFAVGVEAIQSIGCRAVVLVARDDLIFAANQDIHVARYAPLSKLLPRSRAIVHAGGYGTTAASLVAGVPSVVVPLAFDQLFHASRLRRLGVARSISPKRLSTRRLTKELNRVLTDDRFHARTRALAAELRQEDGAARAADEIDRQIGRPR